MYATFNPRILFIDPYHYILRIFYLQNEYISLAFYVLLGSIEAPRKLGLFGCRNVGSPISKTTRRPLKLPLKNFVLAVSLHSNAQIHWAKLCSGSASFPT